MLDPKESILRKGAISVKRRDVKSRMDLDADEDQFYLPDIKANYSEYSKYDGTSGIPKSLKEFRKTKNKHLRSLNSNYQTPSGKGFKKL